MLNYVNLKKFLLFSADLPIREALEDFSEIFFKAFKLVGIFENIH